MITGKQIKTLGFILILGCFTFSFSLFEGFSQDFAISSSLVARRMRDVKRVELDYSFVKDNSLLQALRSDVADPRLANIIRSVKQAGVRRIYLIEVPDSDAEGFSMGAKAFPEVVDILKRNYRIDIEQEDTGVILFPTSFSQWSLERRGTVIEHEMTHVLKDFDPEIGRKEFVYYSGMQREIGNLKLDDSTGEENLSSLERKFLDELGINVGNFLLVRYLGKEGLVKFALPYGGMKIDAYEARLKKTESQQDKEFLFKMAYFLTVTSFEVQNQSLPLLPKLIAVTQPYLKQEDISRIIAGPLTGLRDLLKTNEYPRLLELRKIIFKG